jgi:hypothetical protein
VIYSKILQILKILKIFKLSILLRVSTTVTN